MIRMHYLSRLMPLALALVVLFSCCPVFRGAAEEGTRLAALNCGKADCLLLLTGGQAYLVDAGLEQTFPHLLAMLEEYGVTSLDGVFLTHCHKDHYGGLLQLAKSGIPVKCWYAPAIYDELPDGGHPAELAAAARGAQVTWLQAGDTVPTANGAFTVLGPVVTDTENENNNSLVMRFACDDGSILFAGDMKEEEEITLLERGLLTHCDILKCGHHGDGGATKKALLNAVTPKAALISTCTAEEPDTPSPKTLERLVKMGCSVTVTQNVRDAAEMTLRAGTVTVRDVAFSALPERTSGIDMRLDVQNDLVVLTSAAEVTIPDAVLYSTEGTQLFSLGTITVTPSGLTIGSAKSPDSAALDILLPGDKRLLSKKKLDVTVLYDAFGRGISRADNGLEE